MNKIILENQIVIMEALLCLNELPNRLVKELKDNISSTRNVIKITV